MVVALTNTQALALDSALAAVKGNKSQLLRDHATQKVTEVEVAEMDILLLADALINGYPAPLSEWRWRVEGTLYGTTSDPYPLATQQDGERLFEMWCSSVNDYDIEPFIEDDADAEVIQTISLFCINKTTGGKTLVKERSFSLNEE